MSPPTPPPAARIAVLSPLAIDQIAAGEVVERPASVVKELVDNAIDAGASRIDVELEDGGVARISVRDNGRGIHPDDLLLAVTRHATSKLRDPSELTDINTLGFRGEALASVAAVARVDLRSRQPHAAVGVHLHARPGEPPRLAPAGMPVGTQIEVHGLFANLPARRKFMRAEATEVGQCSETVLRLAIVHPEVHFTLRHGRRELLALPKGTASERVAQVLGRRAAGPLFAFSGEEDGVAVQVWLPTPEAASRGRGGPYLIVRRRVVRERSLGQIVAQAYGLTGEATACVWVEPPRASVDVNVHPQKSEVRFSDPQRVYAAVRRVLAAAMAAAPWAGQERVAGGADGPVWPPMEMVGAIAGAAADEDLADETGETRDTAGAQSVRTGNRGESSEGAQDAGAGRGRRMSAETGVTGGDTGVSEGAGREDGARAGRGGGRGIPPIGFVTEQRGAGAGVSEGTGGAGRDPRAGQGPERVSEGTGRDPRAGHVERVSEGAGRDPRGVERVSEGAGRDPRGAERVSEGAGGVEEREAGRVSEGTGGGRAGGYRLTTRALASDYDEHKRGMIAAAAALRPADARVDAAAAPVAPPAEIEAGLFAASQLVVDAAEAAPAATREPAGPRTGGPEFLLCLPGPVAVFAERDALLAVDLRRLRSHLVYLRLQRDLIGKRTVAIQGLLNPAVVHRAAEEVGLIMAAQAELRTLGVDVDRFGEDAVVVRGVPAHLRHCVDDADVGDLIARIVPWLRIRTREADASAIERGLLGAIATTHGSDPAPRLARRWLGELIEAGATIAEVPGVRRWTAGALLGGDVQRRPVAGAPAQRRGDGAPV